MSMPELIHHSGWPWPLDAVQDWFESFWDQINAWISDAVSGITGFITSSINTVSGWISGAVETLKSWITTSIAVVNDWIGNVAGWISSAITTICTFVSDSITAIGTWISDSAGWLWDQILPLLVTITTALSDFATFVGKTVSDIGGWLVGVIWGWVDGALRWATDTFRWLHDEITAGFGWIVASVSDAFSATLHNLMGGIGAVFQPLIDPLTDFASSVASFFAGIDVTLPLDVLWDLFTRVGESISRFFAAHSPITPAEALITGHSWRAEMDNQLHAWAQGTILAEGLSMGQLDVSMGHAMDVPKIRAASDLGLTLYKEEFEASLLIPFRQALMQAYTPLIPPIPDLIRFVVREVITPEKFYELLPLQGYSREKAEWFWDAHWELPGPRDLYDAFHRKIITAEELDKYIIWHDYKPDPRPGIEKSDVDIMRGVIKTLIPRVDLRYAWEMGRLSDDELVEWYERLGYEEDAPLMAEIQMIRGLVEEVHKVRDEWIRDFVDGFILEDTLRANLEAIGIGATRINYYVTYATKKRDREVLKDLIDLYEDGFQKDLVTEEELRDRLTEIIVAPEVADLRVEKAYTKKYRRPFSCTGAML